IPNEVWEGLENIFTPFNSASDQKKPPISDESYDNNPLINTGQHEERNPINPLEKIETRIDLDSLQSHTTDPVAMFNPNGEPQQENILNNPSPSTLTQQNNFYGNQRNRQEVDPLALFSDKYVSDKYTRRNIKNDNPLNLILDNAEPLTSSDKAAIPEPQEIRHQDTEPSITQILSSPPPPLFTAEDSTHYENSTNKEGNHYRSDERLNIDPIDVHSPISNPVQSNKIQLDDKLLTALLDGMGIGYIKKPQFDEQMMYQLGKLFSQLFQGIMALNASRTSLKNRILLKNHTSASITQIMADANNPFQLLPSGQAVLVQMFGDHMPGFMSPEESTRDILIELQAHQLGAIAGLQTIATDILRLLEPSAIEQKARKEGSLSDLPLSITHKAFLWDYFTQHYQKIIHDIEQNNIPFGESFLQSYEAEISRYKESQNNKKN
ncbi:type VI secretion system-associated FHA domain protein, partial [Xenorhabdus santafensis]|uniref:type VI secretion system-associated FHA domain protein n=1 Tax=Xenorhabdus santafensis TaxID=2582833 RepID=UPI0029E7D5B7